LWLPCRPDPPARTGDRRDRSAAAADRAGGQAGSRGRRVERRRLRLGVGIGWNEVEYQALGENFRNRAARMEEQIAILRELWTQPVVTFYGRWHRIEEAGIKPLPTQRPIPIWIGATADAGIERAGRIADGWFPQRASNDQARAQVERLRQAAAAAGRQPEALGVEARLSIGQVPQAEWARFAEGWRGLGATHLCVNTMGAGLRSPQDHIDALRRVQEDLS
jgi:alkanesulfonate monooxygenase SsuD/methylene tetrahydromethanopterin reductase-like flavin-dependent oxidoreductase (luciferase family)